MPEFKDFKLGINLSKSDKQLAQGELRAATNWKYGDFGSLITREGVKNVTGSALGSSKYVKHLTYVPGSTNYIYAVADDYKLYRLTGSEPTLAFNASLGTLEGDATIVPFNGYGIVLDGSYIKTVQGTTLALAYDDGSGPGGYQYTNNCGYHDVTTDLYSGSVTKAGAKITTQSWDAGYTIPLTTIEAWLSKTGSPTGDITAYIYNAAGSSLLGTSTTTVSSADLTTNGTKQVFAFDTPYAMALSTDYIFAIGYSGGDSSNYVSLYATGVSSGGNQYQYSGSWSSVATKDPLISVKPGRPPKGSFGDVKSNRIWIAGDPDNPGLMWFTNLNTAFDYSTVDGGGFVGSIDDNSNNYEIGGIIAHFGDLYIFGKKEQPYLSKLTGSTPGTFSLPPSFQQIYADHKSLISVVNDIWCASADAVNSISGIQAYGDIRAFSEGDPVKNIIRDYFSTAAFAGYNPGDGQYILKMAGYANMLVCHTKHPTEVDGMRRYPWTEYILKDLTPTALTSFNNKFYMPCTDGEIYILDSDLVEDDGTLPDYTLTSGISEIAFSGMTFKALYTNADSASWSLDYKTDISFVSGTKRIVSAGADFQTASLGTGVKFRLSGSTSNDGVFTVSSTSTTTSIITVDEAITTEAAGQPVSISLDYGSLSFYKNGSPTALVTKTIKANNSPRRTQIHFNVKSLQWSLHSLTLSSQLRFKGLQLEGRKSGSTF